MTSFGWTLGNIKRPVCRKQRSFSGRHIYRMSVLVSAVLCILAVSHVGITHGQDSESGTGTASVTLPNTDVCGKRDGSTRLKRVIGGSDVESGMFPWIAALGYTEQDSGRVTWICAGSLVTDRHIVTVAQCIVDARPHYNLKVVRLGVLDLNDTEAKDYEVDSATIHPGYNRTRKENDIGIIKLKNKVTFSRLIQPICLPTLDEFRTENFTGSAAYIAGWGTTEYGGEKPTRLQKAQLRVWGQQECKDAYKMQKRAVIDNRVVCANDNGKDSCQGDSGAPLMIPYGQDSNYYLYGMVSYGLRCGEPRYPGVYTRVSEFIDWIVPNLKE